MNSISNWLTNKGRGSYLLTPGTTVLQLHSSEDDTGITPWTFLLAHLSTCAKLLEDHFRVATGVTISVIEAHVDEGCCRIDEDEYDLRTSSGDWISERAQW
jgi:hypothetical protein